MFKNILQTVICIFCMYSSFGQNSEEIVRQFVTSVNKSDIESVRKYLHENISIAYGDNEVCKDKSLCTKFLEQSINFNTQYADIEIKEITDISATLYAITSNNYTNLLEYIPAPEKIIYSIADKKIKKIVITIDQDKYTEEDSQHNHLRQIAFDQWLAKRNMVSSDFPETIEGDELVVKFIKSHKGKKITQNDQNEIAEFIAKMSQKKKNNFIKNDIKSYKEFVYKLLMTYRSKNYDDMVKLYITEKEFIEMFEHYGQTAAYGKHEYDENVRIMSEDRFKYISQIKFYEESACFETVEELQIKPHAFCKTFNQEELKNRPEYYFLEERIRIKSLFNFYESREKDINLAEIIYIPNKGWRLTNLN